MRLSTWALVGFLGIAAACDGGGEPAPEPAAEPAAAPAPAPEPAAAEAADDEDGDDDPDGRWRRARPAQDAVTEQLDALGYMDGYEKAPSNTGVIRHAKDQTAGGYNFYVSGHDSMATLMDMDGKVLHTWSLPFSTAFPDEPPTDRADNTQAYWRRAHLFDNGDILAIHSHYGVVRLDKDSTLKWAVKNGAHHHLQVTDDGSVYVLTRKRELFEAVNANKKLWGDAVDVISPDGQAVRSVSILQALLDSGFDEVKGQLGSTGSLLHTNSLQVLDGQMASLIPAFKKGNVLLSFRTLDMLAVLDMETEKIVWVKTGPWLKQHDAFALDGDSMIVFNNNRGNKHSEILIFNPKTDAMEWKFAGTREEPFYSSSCGANQLLPNGNVLATESNFGRAIEISKDGEVVWEFVSPHRAGSDNELIATLFDVDRVPADFDISWASSR